MTHRDKASYRSRAGAKLDEALTRFNVDVTGKVCADLGSNVGGFVDCLLRRGAGLVHAVDTAEGVLDWSLRNDLRVIVHERTNALGFRLDEPVDLVTVDVGWTRQHLVLPRALELVRRGGVIVSLIKPHYEADRAMLRGGVLSDEDAETVLGRTIRRLADLRIGVAECVESPLRGDRGNREWLALFR